MTNDKDLDRILALTKIIEGYENLVEYLLVNWRPHINKDMILQHLEENNWDVTNTARKLGIRPQGLFRYLKKHGIKRPSKKPEYVGV